MPKQFAFCKTCRLNHDQGKGHKYSNKHKKFLAQALDKFHKKIQDILFFIKNPMLLRSDDRQRNRFWCVVCEEDIDESQSKFACSNAIKHLASSGHMECLKSFWWENGAEFGKRDMFRICQEDLVKDKRCQVRSKTDVGASGSSVAVHDACLKSSVQKANANQQPLLQRTHQSNFAQLLSNNRVTCDRVSAEGYLEQQHCLPVGSASSDQGWLDSFSRPEVYNSACSVKDEYQACRLTSIHRTPLLPGEANANVHSGAPPPWLIMNEGNEAQDIQRVSKTQQRKLKKLRNPKRVGAAWAEQRRAELERGLKGEASGKDVASDATWLPNFGRVWQSGSRKDSRKEFETEKNIEGKLVSKNERAGEIQPYISKRMRLESGSSSSKTCRSPC